MLSGFQNFYIAFHLPYPHQHNFKIILSTSNRTSPTFEFETPPPFSSSLIRGRFGGDGKHSKIYDPRALLLSDLLTIHLCHNRIHLWCCSSASFTTSDSSSCSAIHLTRRFSAARGSSVIWRISRSDPSSPFPFSHYYSNIRQCPVLPKSSLTSIYFCWPAVVVLEDVRCKRSRR